MIRIRTKVQVSGSMLRALTPIAKTLQGVVEKHAKSVLSVAEGGAPYDTGELHGSGVIEKWLPLEWRVGFTADHAPFVEYGTGQRGSSSAHPTPSDGTSLRYKSDWAGMPAQPFLTPAAELERQRYYDAIKAVLK